nr:uncharacterized protein LOC123755844 isoform X2 [Procambarus clarkii]
MKPGPKWQGPRRHKWGCRKRRWVRGRRSEDQGAAPPLPKFVAPTVVTSEGYGQPITEVLNVISVMQEFCDKSLEELRHEYYQVTPACRTVRGGGGGPSEWPGVQLPEQDCSRLVSKTKGRPVWRELRQGRLTAVLAKGRLAACSSSTNTAPSLAFDGVTPLSPRYDPSAEGHTSTVLGAAPSPDTATPGAGTSPVFGAFATSKASLSFSFSKLNIVGEGDWSTTRVYDSAASAGYNNNTNVPKDKIFTPQLTLDLPTVFGRTVKATQSWFEEPAIEEQISCPVCMETYLAVTRSPVVLPRCGHTFCRPCLTRLEERGGVQSPALEERGSVQSPALEERGSVQSPALEERGSVQSPALEERGGVQSPALEETGSVQSPALEERGSVQSPALEERGSVQSPALEERGSVQSPALEERGSVQSPALEERGSVQSPALEERGGVQSPALEERGSVQSPALEERGSVQSPALEERGSVQSPALEERGSVQSPALEERGSVQSPALEERGSVECPVCKTAHSGVSVSELPILYTILNLSEAYTKAKASGSVLERCESHGDQLCVWCRHCSEALCGLCLLDTQRHKSHKLERIINIADINNNVKQQARNFFEYSENRQNKITNELHLIIRRIVELCHMSNSIQGQVKTVSEVMTNYGNQAGIKRSMEALSQLGNALKTLHHVTGSLRRGEEMVGQAVQSGASDEANMDYIGSSRLLTVRSNPEQVRGCEGSDNEGDSSQPEGSAMVGEAGVQVERSVNGLGANSQVKRSLGDENDSIQVGESYNRSHTEAAGNRSQTEAAGNRSQTEAAGSRSQTEAAGSRSHTEAAGNRSQTEAAGNRSQTEAAGNRSQTEAAGNRSHTEAAGNRSQTEAAGNRSHTEAAGNRSHTEAAGNRSQTEAAGNRSHTEAAGNRSHTEAAGNRSQTEAADNRSRTEVVALRCCGTISDGRQMGLTLEDEHLHLCALTPSPLHPHITLQVPLLERFLSREKPEVFFDLSVDNKCLGRIYIQLWGDMRRAKHFLALCLGTLGPSYKGSKFDRISDRSQPGEVLHCKGYSDKSGPSSLGLMDNLEWDGKYRQLQKAGQLIASGGGQAQTDGSFGICTKDNLFKTFSCPFGMVVSGMDVVREAVNHAGDVVVSEVGAVAVDINCQD